MAASGFEGSSLRLFVGTRHPNRAEMAKQQLRAVRLNHATGGATSLFGEDIGCRESRPAERVYADSWLPLERQHNDPGPDHDDPQPFSCAGALVEKNKCEDRHEDQAQLVHRGNL